MNLYQYQQNKFEQEEKIKEINQVLYFLPPELCTLLFSYTEENTKLIWERGVRVDVFWNKNWYHGVLCAFNKGEVLIHINDKKPQWIVKDLNFITPVGLH